jgi:hypothetical protein
MSLLTKSHEKFIRVLVPLSVFFFSVLSSSQGQIVIEDQELSLEESHSATPLYGFKKISSSALRSLQAGGSIGLPHQKKTDGTIYVSEKKHARSLSVGGAADPLAEDLPRATTINSHTKKIVTINKKASSRMVDSYSQLEHAPSLSPFKAMKGLNNVNASLASAPALSALTEAVRFRGGQVTFGNPLVFTAREKKLVLPESISSKYDVYWIEFAVSFRDLDVKKMEKLIFGVSMPPGRMALELIPLRFDKETKVKQITSSPEIKVQAPGGEAVELGKFYEQEEAYKVLKPVIVASGLQENEFSWSLEDEAVRLGSRRFIAILEVPKGERALSVILQAGAKTKPSLLAQGNIIGTEPQIVALTLKGL